MVSNLGFHVMHMYALYTPALSSKSFGIHGRDSYSNLCRGGVLRILYVWQLTSRNVYL